MTRGNKIRANGEGSIFAIGTPQGKRWKAETTIGYDGAGRRVVASGTGATKAIAIERRDTNRLKLLVMQGKAPSTVLAGREIRINKTSVENYLRSWFESLNPVTVGASTRRQYEGNITRHINPHIGEIPLTLLSRANLRELFYKTLPNKAYDPKNPEKRLGAGAVLNVWKPLNKALKDAHLDGLIQQNPLEGLDRPAPVMKEIDIDTSRPKALLQHLEGDIDQAKWLTSFLLGLRVSEKLGLTWDCIDLDPKEGQPPTITIKQQLSRDHARHGCRSKTDREPVCGKRSAHDCPKRIDGKGLYIKEETKTKNIRKLPIPYELEILLVEHKERWEAVKDSGEINWIEHGDGEDTEKTLSYEPEPGLENLVFTMDNAKPIRHEVENQNWHALCTKYGFTNDRGHISRHTTATMLAEAGVPPEVAKLILGHTSERMTRYYTHLKATKTTLEPLQNFEIQLLGERQEYDFMDLNLDIGKPPVESRK